MTSYSYLALRRRRNVLFGTKSSDISLKADHFNRQQANLGISESAEQPPTASPQKTRAGAISPRFSLLMPRIAG
jgi:hypothetical protein